jgi:ABC-type multidrug transport system ATPase subunit
LDVSSRAQVWRTIDSLKKKGNHAVIITTHSMEEAEALSTRIGIMAKGGFKCIGSPQHLKNKFGDGYSLYFRVHIFTNIADVEATNEEYKEAELLCLKDLSEHVLASLGHSARLVSQHVTSDVELLDMHSVEASRTAPNYYQITAADKNFRAVSWMINAYFRFGSSQGVKLADIFQNAEKLVNQKKTEEELSALVRKPFVFSVMEWGIHQASLEDVFIRVAKDI